MKRIFFLSWSIFCAINIAHAERADRDKETHIEAKQLTADDVKQVNEATGDVILTRGTLVMKADRVVVTTDPSGYQSATLYANPGNLATFRQKRDGKADDGKTDLWIDGEAERIEYDGKTEVTKLFSKARLRRLQGDKPTDEVHGEFISYDSRTEFYSVNNTPDGSSQPNAGRVRAVIQPRTGASK